MLINCFHQVLSIKHCPAQLADAHVNFCCQYTVTLTFRLTYAVFYGPKVLILIGSPKHYCDAFAPTSVNSDFYEPLCLVFSLYMLHYLLLNFEAATKSGWLAVHAHIRPALLLHYTEHLTAYLTDLRVKHV